MKRPFALVSAVAAIALLLTALAAASSWPGPPTAKPPTTGTAGAPPPAWFESARTSQWLLYGSYCWSTACADFIPPDQRTGVPVITISRGGTIRFHLRYVPKSVGVQYAGLPVAKLVSLPALAVTSWRPPRSGTFSLQVAAHGSSASYVGKVRLG